ncbi:LacI family DNA-binding transcriptional regulator [Ornithinimicrobium cavernae]|uniref:LacI family DNA-binding transcriptional regulator n=1 Tax=Ornithinimicrobium cavernae TaxID=2666047 RepID=UPI000D697949|nr:LacI family DNA-binding transcriptional regulator [Ornithinimicrobium cavernae]
MATLSDVAARAGVSKSTASRALSTPALVAPATVERVLEATVELGFVPNRAARGLARGRSGIVALVVPTLSNAFFTPIIGGSQDRAAEDDLQLTVAVNALESSEDLRRFERLAREVDGMLIVAPRAADATIAHLAGLKPTILVDRELDGVDSVTADTASAFARLVHALVGEGHTRLIYIGGPDRTWQNTQREQAVAAAAGRSQVELEVLGPLLPTFEAGAGVTEEVLALEASVVLPYATDLGLGLLLNLHRAGRASWRLDPDDEGRLAVVGVPGAPMVDVDGVALGRRAMSRLAALINGLGGGPRAERLPVPVSWPQP